MLKPSQSFDVIFFADPDTTPTALSKGLISATPQTMIEFQSYISGIRAAGSTDPISGLQMAFRSTP